VIEVSDARIGDFESFDELQEKLANGGIDAFLWDMLHLHLKGWHPKQIYKSAALLEQKRHQKTNALSVVDGAQRCAQ
jgi:hypothetical protein